MTHRAPPQPERLPPNCHHRRWADLLRTIITAAVALLPIVPELIRAYGLDSLPYVATATGVLVTTNRVLTSPRVEIWLQDYVPWLSAAGRTRHRYEKEYHDFPADDYRSSGRHDRENGREN